MNTSNHSKRIRSGRWSYYERLVNGTRFYSSKGQSGGRELLYEKIPEQVKPADEAAVLLAEITHEVSRVVNAKSIEGKPWAETKYLYFAPRERVQTAIMQPTATSDAKI